MNRKYDIIYLSSLRNTNVNFYIKTLQKVYYFLFFLNIEYPGFHSWFQNNVIPDLETKQKEIILIMCGEYIAGVSILKNTYDEKKICTIRVGKHFRGQGLGKKLMEISLMELNTDKPMITVSSYRYPQFQNIFNYFGFKMEDISCNYYRNRNDEICFNGQLIGSKYNSNIEPFYKLLYICDHTVDYNYKIIKSNTILGLT